MVEVHNRSRYKAGCRCDVCRKAQSDYRKDLRRRSKAPKRALTSVPALPSPTTSAASEPTGLGPVEAGVLAEIEGLTTAQKRPGLVAGALAMARLLDSPLNSAQQPQAMARLQAALDQLRKGADSRKSWLADVRKLTPRNQVG